MINQSGNKFKRAGIFILAVALAMIPVVSFAFNYGDIEASRMAPGGWTDTVWSDPGSWTTYDVTQNGLPANDQLVNATQKVQQIIASHPGQKMILYFPAGTYNFYSDLQINESNVRLKGDGMTQTSFKISIPTENVGGIGFVGDGKTGSAVSVTGSPWEGSTYVYVSDVSSFSSGDFVQLYTQNGVHGGSDYFYSQIFKISWIDTAAKKIVFTQKLGLDFPSSDVPKLQKLSMLENVGIQDVKVYRVRDNMDYSDNVYMRYVNNGYVKDIESSYCANSHIVFAYSRNVIAERNKVHHSFEYGEGGHGYGIVANYATTNARITDNKLWNLRHHILLQKGANHSVISYNSLEDIMNNSYSLPLHGHFSHNNLIEGNMLQDGLADNAWGASGPRNTWFRNLATGHVGSGDTATSEQNVIGNITYDLWYSGSNHYLAANKQTKYGSTDWGQLNANSSIPASLYLTSKPAFLGSKPWPLFGPNVDSSWGSGNTVPARDRAK